MVTSTNLMQSRQRGSEGEERSCLAAEMLVKANHPARGFLPVATLAGATWRQRNVHFR
jgi:hypothetical protein